MAKATRPTDHIFTSELVWPAQDDLQAAKGVMLSVLVGALFWAIVGTAIWRFFLS